MEVAELRRKSVGELHGIAERLGIEEAMALTKPKLIERIREHQQASRGAPLVSGDRDGPAVSSASAGPATNETGSGAVETGRESGAVETPSAPTHRVERKAPSGEGVLQVLPEGYGFLRCGDTGYTSGPDDVYVGPTLIRRFDLRAGDTVRGPVSNRHSGARNRRLAHVETVNGRRPTLAGQRPSFEELRPRYPDRRLRLEAKDGSLTMRVIDLLAPIGKGQRGLIVSPPKAGKTTILREMAQSIEINEPDTQLIVLLIDERPEEVTEMRESIQGEVVASTFDCGPIRHVQVAEVVLDRARRLAEARRDVVILLDSITRLARAYNANMPQSGRIMSGGVDSKALQRPKRFFGAARDLDGGGSITIIATALVDTGSRMDEVIFEEFKGTGNMELVLDRSIADRRVFPAININLSGTRKEELLLSETELNRVHVLRNFLASMPPDEAISFLVGRMAESKTNAGFLDAMARGG